MNSALEQMFEQLMINKVPDIWKNISYLSLKPLGTWIKDFNERIEFWNQWIEKKELLTYCITAFYFP